MKCLPISLLTLGAAALACATLPASMASAETIECAAEVPVPPKGHWYYRIIDGRKCWYQGKAMIPKSSLRWADSSVPEAEAATSEAQAAKPSTDGRNVVAPPAPEPAVWPTPVVDDTSFEARWRGLMPER